MQILAAFLVACLAATGITANIQVPRSDSHPVGKHSHLVSRNPNHRPSGSEALSKAYLKYGKPLPPDLANAIARQNTGSGKTGSVVNAPGAYDVEYLAPVSIGTPAQILPLDFDTGSADLWVFSTETQAKAVKGQVLYNPSNSKTAYALQGQSWNITYGDGSSSSGDVYSDVVTVGGLTVLNQAVESAKQVSSSFTADTASSGLLGLAFSSINTVTPTQQNTFFANAQSSLDQPVFTVDLKHGADGTYNFGFINSSLYNSSITYTPVDQSQGFWGWTSTGYGVGTTHMTHLSMDGIADTGTTLLLLPDSVVSAYYRQVSGARYNWGQGGYTFNCNAHLPDFCFGVGANCVINIPGSYLNYAPTGSGNSCFGGIQSNDGIGFSIFGDIALKAAFVVFDAGNTQLGWATKAL